MLKNVPSRTCAGDEVPRRALRPQDGVRREPEARLRQQGRSLDAHGQYRRPSARRGSRRSAYKRKWDKYEPDGTAKCPSATSQLETLARGARRQHPRAEPLLPRRRDGADDRYGQGVRLQDRSFHHAVEATRSRTCWPRRHLLGDVGRLVGLQDGGLRRHQGEHRAGRQRRRLRDRAFGLGERHPAAQPGSGQGAGRRAPAGIKVIATTGAWTWLGHQSGQGARILDADRLARGRARWPTWCCGTAIRSASTRKPSRSGSTARCSSTPTIPKRRPVSDFELGQPGEGDMK